MKVNYTDMLERSAEAQAFLKQLANSSRLMILCALNEGELSVSELNCKIPLSQSALSQHLAKLRKANFVSTRRDSQIIYYRLTDTRVKTIITDLYNLFCA